MLIERKLKTPGGTVVEIDGEEYHFKPQNGDDDNPHVCEVRNPAHIKLLLAVDDGEAYVEVPSSTQPASDIPSEFDGMTKAQLCELAKEEFGVELKKNKAVRTLIAEIMELRKERAEQQ